jgi:hypothetical protein
LKVPISDGLCVRPSGTRVALDVVSVKGFF